MSTCSSASRDLAEPLAGTAAVARTWLLVEQPGPWGAKALTSSHLDPRLGRALDRAVAGTGVRVALIRRPGRHADTHSPSRRRVFLAHTEPGRGWIRTAVLAPAAEPDGASPLTGLDFTALGAGRHGGLWDAYHGDPLALVCTNARRDRCCALLGRPLAAELASTLDTGAVERIWEITHLGGHRFAPTLLVLPHGYAYGRTTAETVVGALEAARDGRMSTEDCRGRSTWDRPGQAADLAVRAVTGERRADALRVAGTVARGPEDRAAGAAPAWTATVEHTDGRSWQVDVEQGAAGPPRPESCGAEPGTPTRMEVREVRST